ncbi:hypothetical protein TNCV_3027171 [Trichonephila clavipes]|nr:hypothetical protein TNCV_3027171 [Trichonephila clavipes]
MTVAELQQKENLKVSSNIILWLHQWYFKHKYSQDKRVIEKLAWKMTDFFKPVGIMKVWQSLLERKDEKATKIKMRKGVRLKLRKNDIDSQKRHNHGFKRWAKTKETIKGDKTTPRALLNQKKTETKTQKGDPAP